MTDVIVTVTYNDSFCNPQLAIHAVLDRDDSGYGLTGYGGYVSVTSYTILNVKYCNRSNLALFNRY